MGPVVIRCNFDRPVGGVFRGPVPAAREFRAGVLVLRALTFANVPAEGSDHNLLHAGATGLLMEKLHALHLRRSGLGCGSLRPWKFSMQTSMYETSLAPPEEFKHADF